MVNLLIHILFNSEQFQTWLEGERSKVVDQLNDINPTYLNKYFLPKLASATATILLVI